MEALRQSINNWERRHRTVHHGARYQYHAIAAKLQGGGNGELEGLTLH